MGIPVLRFWTCLILKVSQEPIALCMCQRTSKTSQALNSTQNATETVLSCSLVFRMSTSRQYLLMVSVHLSLHPRSASDHHDCATASREKFWLQAHLARDTATTVDVKVVDQCEKHNDCRLQMRHEFDGLFDTVHMLTLLSSVLLPLEGFGNMCRASTHYSRGGVCALLCSSVY